MTASMTEPESRMTGEPSSKSVTMIRRGTAASSMRSIEICSERNRRQVSGGNSAPRRSAAWAIRSGFQLNTLRDRALRHSSHSLSTCSTQGSAARKAAFTEPMDDPTRTSGVIPASNSALSMPTWMLPRFPPPDITKAFMGMAYPGPPGTMTGGQRGL
jgi:hypothetical protein